VAEGKKKNRIGVESADALIVRIKRLHSGLLRKRKKKKYFNKSGMTE
jgi:hypothetical protein